MKLWLALLLVSSFCVHGERLIAQDKSGARPGLIKLPEAGGTVVAETGSFRIVSNRGASQYALPLPTLPTRGGFQPLVELNYNQFAGDGGQGFGIGWSLSVPSIEVSTELGVPLSGVLPSGEFRNYLSFQGQKLIFLRSDGGLLHYRLRASEDDIRIIYHKNPYFPGFARPINGLAPGISSGFEVTYPDGRRLLFSGDPSIAEASSKVVTRYVLTYEVAPDGESIAYSSIKDGGRSYLTDISFAGGASRYHFDLIDGLGHLQTYGMGYPQQSRKLYAKLSARFKGTVHAQWCFAYVGRSGNDRNAQQVKTHPDCLERAKAENSAKIDPNSLSVLDELVSIYRYGSDAKLSKDSLRLPTMSFGYSSWSRDRLAARQLVYPLPSLIDSSNFSVKNYELADLNHDGLVDAIRRNSNGNSDVFASSGDLKKLYQAAQFWTVQRGDRAVAPDVGSDNFHFADLNGDSFVDLLQFDNEATHVYLGEATGGFRWSGQSVQLTSDSSLNAAAFTLGQAQFVDLNNDGKSDVLTTALDATGQTVWKAYLNLSVRSGKLWTFKFSPKTFAFPFPQSNRKLSDSNFRVSDVNGDGLQDIVYLSSSLEANQSGLCVYLNQGHIYDLTDRSLLFGNPADENARCGRGGRLLTLQGLRGLNSMLGLWLVDVNGDGIMDISTMGETNQDLLVWLGYGDLQVTDQPLALHLNLPVNISASLDASRSRVADIDGDGQAEILIFDESASGDNRALMIDFNREADRQLIKSNLLTSVDFESGLRYDIRYATSTTERVRDARLGLETSPLHFPMVVAKQLVSSQGIPGLTRQSVQVQEFFYHKPYYDAEDREFLGFSKVETLNYGDSYTDESSFVQDEYYTYGQDPGARKLAGKLKSKRSYRLLADAYFQKQAALSNVFNPADPSTHSWLDQSADQSLPKPGLLMSEEDEEWVAVEADAGAWFVRKLSETSLRYAEDLGLLTRSPYRKQKTWTEFDVFNLPQKLQETIAAVEGAFGVTLPETITDTQLAYDDSRSQLADLGIVNAPDYKIVQRNGAILDFEKYRYDDVGRKIQETSYVESHLAADVPEFGSERLTAYERVIDLAYDAFGNQISVSDFYGLIEGITYDSEGIFPIQRRLPKASPTAEPQIWSFQYTEGRLHDYTSPLGLTTTFAYDTLGRNARMSTPDGAEQNYSYKMGLAGNPSMIKTDERRYRDIDHPDAGETFRIERLIAYRPDGTKIAELENASTKTEQGVRVKSYSAYNRNKKKIFTWTPYSLFPKNGFADISVSKIFSSMNTIPTPAVVSGPISNADPRLSSEVGVATWYDYQGRVREEHFPSKMTTSYRYPVWGSVSETRYSQGSATVRIVNSRLENEIGTYATAEENPTSGVVHVTAFEHDALGNLSALSMSGESTARQIVYDNKGQMESQTLPGLGSYHYLYDQRGRLTQTVRVSADGSKREKVELAYDALNRQTAQYLNNSLALSNTYDAYPANWQPNPAFHKVVARPIGLLASRQSYDVANGLFGTSERLAYDPNGRIVQREVQIGTGTYSESYRYLLDGSLKRVENPMKLQGNYILDESGRLHGVKIQLPGANAKEETVIDNVSYNGKGQIEQVLYRPIGATLAQTDMVYDNATLQMKGIRTHYVEAGKNVWLQDLNMTIDGNNNILGIKDNVIAGTLGHVDRTGTFAYNWKSELTQTVRYNRTLNYDYLPSGSFKKNEEMAPGLLTTAPSTTLIPQGLNRDDYRFDGFGQLIRSPSVLKARYNPLGQLVYVETSQAETYFGYNAEGIRSYKRVVDKGERRNADSFYPMKSMTVEPGSPQSYIFVGDSRLVRLESLTGEWYYYLRDHLGSSDIMMHASGKPVEQMLYQAYGTEENPETLSTAWKTHLTSVSAIKPKERTHHRFTGQYRDDDSGLYYYGARYYDAKLGRFISPDPLYLEKPDRCMKNARECNLYIYGFNNPMKYIDPTGLSGYLTLQSHGGHSWIEYHKDGETFSTTYGTYGNTNGAQGVVGLNLNSEIGQKNMGVALTTHISDAQEAKMMKFIAGVRAEGDDGWRLLNPCSAFASDAYRAATGTNVEDRDWWISTPGTLMNSIVNAGGHKANTSEVVNRGSSGGQGMASVSGEDSSNSRSSSSGSSGSSASSNSGGSSGMGSSGNGGSSGTSSGNSGDGSVTSGKKSSTSW